MLLQRCGLLRSRISALRTPIGYNYNYASFVSFCRMASSSQVNTGDNFLEDADFIAIKRALIGANNSDLNEYQKTVINSIINEKQRKPHNLVIQPTGSGKSLCFQLPILYTAYKAVKEHPENPTMGIVITPTISLMEDQVQQLTDKINDHGLPLKVACYHHCLLEKEKEDIINGIKSRYINLLYATPESLLQIKDEITEETVKDNEDEEDDDNASYLDDHEHVVPPLSIMDNDNNGFAHQQTQDLRLNVSHIAFDECHIITESTILYRPQYCYDLQYLISEIANLSATDSKPQILALTASLTNADRVILMRKLGIHSNETNEFVSNNWKRPNLSLEITYTKREKPKSKGRTLRLDLIEQFKYEHNRYSTPSIIYCSTRQAVDRLKTRLIVDEMEAKDQDETYEMKKIERYHSDCNRRERRDLQQRFYENRTDILVSTNAFGLGVNKNDVTTIIHLGVPPSLQRYYQETGRAGRNHHDHTVNRCYCQFDDSSLNTNSVLVAHPLFQPLSNDSDSDNEKQYECIKENLLKFYQMLQFVVKHRNQKVLTIKTVQKHLSENFEFIYGYNKQNYSKNKLNSTGLHDSNGVLVDVKYYVAILKQLEYLKQVQQEYFDVYLPQNLPLIIKEEEEDIKSRTQELDEALRWLVMVYLSELTDGYNNSQWYTIYVADIQQKWEQYYQQTIMKQKKSESTTESDQMLTLKRVENLLELIQLKYCKLFHLDLDYVDGTQSEGNFFHFVKDSEEIGFELEDVENKHFVMQDMKQLLEWDEDVRRQREKWDYFREWLLKQTKTNKGTTYIGNDEISNLFQKYFTEDVEGNS